ncbi:hypothetical protein B0H13DRAFT_1981185, partial [Mycena leptocephala]
MPPSYLASMPTSASSLKFTFGFVLGVCACLATIDLVKHGLDSLAASLPVFLPVFIVLNLLALDIVLILPHLPKIIGFKTLKRAAQDKPSVQNGTLVVYEGPRRRP